MYVKRNLEEKIKKYLHSREIIAVIGPRQSGKTTLLKNLQTTLKNSIYLTLEDQEIINLFDHGIKDFIRLYIKPYDYIFIDEFQYSLNGGKNLKFIYDTEEGKKIFISGSSSTDLTVKGISYLVGRVFVFELYPFSYDEFLRYRDNSLHEIILEYKQSINLQSFKLELFNISPPMLNRFNNLWQEFVIFGGYPRVVLSNDNEEKLEVLKNIFNTYFLKEIKELLAFEETYKLSTLIKLLAVQIGNLAEYNTLSTNSGFSVHNTKRALDILGKTYILKLLKPFFQNKKLEIVKNPKPYFIDTGLRNFAINNFNRSDLRPDKGSLYENTVFTQMLKNDISTNFWRTKSGAEVDFVLEKEGLYLPFEIKSKIAKNVVGKSLHSFLAKYPAKIAVILNENFIEKIKVNETAVLYLPHWVV